MMTVVKVLDPFLHIQTQFGRGSEKLDQAEDVPVLCKGFGLNDL